jgi:hypothetical protein
MQGRVQITLAALGATTLGLVRFPHVGKPLGLVRFLHVEKTT